MLDDAESARNEKVKTMADTVAKINAICSRQFYRRLKGRPATPDADPEFEIKDLYRTLTSLSDTTISRSAQCRPGFDEVEFHRVWLAQAAKLQADITCLKRLLVTEELTTKEVEGKLRVLFYQMNKPFFGGRRPETPAAKTAQTEATYNVQDYSGVVTPSAFEAPKQPASSAPTNSAPIESLDSDTHHDSVGTTNKIDMPGLSSAEPDGASVTKEDVDQNVIGTSVDSTNFPQPDVLEHGRVVSTDMAVGTQTSLSDSDRNDAVSDEAESTPGVDSDVGSSAKEAEKCEDDLEAQTKSANNVDEVTISVPTKQARK